MNEPADAEISHALRHWFPESVTEQRQPVGVGSGFSGARLWKVDAAGRSYVLRMSPRPTRSPCNQIAYQVLQRHLATNGMPAPMPILTADGEAALVRRNESAPASTIWTVSTWMPGVADYWSEPRPEKLHAALATLAQVHRCAETCAAPAKRQQIGVGLSPALAKRHERLAALNSAALSDLLFGAASCEDSAEKALALDAIKLVEATVDGCRRQAATWLTTSLPLQWRLGDVWHDHVLFTGDLVTGLIDFAAADIDSPAGDVARLLGSLVADDADGWRAGLAAYVSVRPLSKVELDAVRFFDASGSVISAANWIGWLWPINPVTNAFTGDRPAGIARLNRLLHRLHILAYGQSGTFA